MPDAMIGKKIGEFVIEERLGQGAMATVYKAFEPSINRHVALKVIRLDEGPGLQEEFRRRFAREAEVIAKLEHIHILPIYAYGINDDLAFLAMRWLRGGTLSEVLKKRRLPLDRASDIFQQIAQGLAYAPRKGIIHRDLKPSNIMLDDAGNAYLTDFGLAKLAEGSGELTRSGTIVGTPAYMSPEQLRGEPLDQRSDIYSMGVILYNMLAGRLPFDTSTSDMVSIIYQHLEKPPTPPSEFNPEIPPAVEEVILKALHKDRSDRYFTATEMSRALNLALGRTPGSSDHLEPAMPARFISTSQDARTPSQTIVAQSRTPLILGAAVIIAAVILAFALLQNNAPNGTQQATLTAESQLVIAAIATQTASAWTPTPVPAATILTGESGPSSSYVPNGLQIAAAAAKLGPNGFIAYIACTQNTEFHAGLAREMGDLARQYRLSYRIYDSNADPYLEVTQVEKARADGATLLIICPLDANLLAASLRSAQEAGLPMVFFSDQMPSYGGILIGGDSYALGLEPGRFAGRIVRDEWGGNADVIILDYPDRADIVERANGLEDGLKELAPRARIIGRYLGATRDGGRASVAKLIADGVKFNVILSINDAGAFGAVEAMEAAGIDPKSVIISSIDAEALAQQYIAEGYFFRGSVQSNRQGLAQAMINSATILLAGGTIPEKILVPPGQMVTKETLEAALTPTS